LLKPQLFVGRDALAMPITADQYDIVARALIEEVKDNYRRYYESYTKPMPYYIGVPMRNGNTASLEWEAAYTFDVEQVTYTFELARDYTFANPIVRETGLKVPGVTFTVPEEAGQYFIRVIATDAGGQTQTAFDSYVTAKGKIYGTRCIYITASGEIVEDIYVED
jgi:spore coat protein H